MSVNLGVQTRRAVNISKGNRAQLNWARFAFYERRCDKNLARADNIRKIERELK
jgi:hypothetical protein